MKPEDYSEITKAIQKYRGLTKNCAKMLVDKFPSFSPMTLYAVLELETKNRMRIMHKRMFGKDNNFYESYLEAVKRQESAGILLKMALKMNCCPALLARKVLENYCNCDSEVDRKSLSKIIKDTTLIKDNFLAYEVYLCNVYDDQYGPISDACNESIGEEYEIKLEMYLKERGITYSNENHLRTKGYDKTPDCKLEVPIAVNGFVINWIESKARFANQEIHKKYIEEQFLSYWNRFGPGLVIYWFGFLDTIVQSSETKYIIMDHFPENITYMDPSSIRQSLL